MAWGGSPDAPLFFIANGGQAPPEVAFMAQGSGLTAYFSRGEALFRAGQASLRQQFVGVDPAVRIEGSHRLRGHANFLIGSEDQWNIGAPVYDAIVYRRLYPGIDMRYGGAGRNLKSEFHVAAGADPGRIRVRYVGAGELRIEESGALLVTVGGRELREEAPVAYQVREGTRIPVSGRFALAGDQTVSFILGAYDSALPVVIDPTLSYSTLLGGSSSDAATALAVDSTGAAYLAGFTASYDFPTASPEQNVSAGGNDVFVAKLNPAGNSLLYCTYIGGKGDDRAYGIAVDASGAAYVTGSTTSSNFPARSALQARLAGAKNAFVLKLNPAGNALVFSTYLGGNGSDIGNAIAIDPSGNIYITGDTTSITFPAGALQKGNHGGQDAFVSKLSSDGSHLVYSTYLGGSSDDHGAAIAVDSGGTAYITGSTYSADFPVAAAFQPSIGGGQDAFVARLAADGNSLLFGTFLGGSGGSLGYPEAGQAIALDNQGNAYVAGVTSSSDFPLLSPLQASRRGSSPDAFVAKLTVAGALSYSTYLGGTGMDAATAIAVDSAGSAYVAGQTFSADLPILSALQASSGGDYDAFWAKLSPAGNALQVLSYLGGAGSDTATAVALDPSGNLYIAGWTLSANFPTANGFQTINAGNYGAFVARIAFGQAAVVGVTPASGSASSQTFAFQFSDTAGIADLTTVSVLFNSTATTSNACYITYNRAANSLVLWTDGGTDPGTSITPGAGSAQNSQCLLNGAGSSTAVSGNVLTLNLAITFRNFGGTQNIYLQAASQSGATGWVQEGVWTVPPGPPTPLSVTPSSGSGTSQTFAFQFSDGKGYSALVSVSVIINSTAVGAGGCYVLYYPTSKLIYLTNDASTAWQGPVTLGQTGTLQNSQCSVSAAGSSVSGSGNVLTVNLALSFQAGFAGTRNIYMEAYDGSDSYFQQEGTWTVPAVTFGPVSVTPSSGSGSSQTFAFQFADPKGSTSILSVSAIINSSLTGVGGCYLLYYPKTKLIYLANDASTAWQGPVTLGQSGTLQDSQCTVSAAGSSVSSSGATLTVNLALSFQAGFGGTRNIYMEAYDGADSGFVQKGSWTIPAAVLGPVSVTPSSGSGSSQTFAFQFADPKGYASLVSVSVIINSSLTGAGGCYLLYYPGSKLIYLTNDSSTAWQGPVTLGQSGTLQNSQCSVSAASSTVSGSSSTLTLNLALNFQHAFSGSRNIYMEAYDGADSGWSQKGTWTVP